MLGFNWRSLAAAGLLLASRAAFSQATAPDGGVAPVVPAPLRDPPPTYSPWLLALAALALLVLTVAGVKLVMNGLRGSRHRRHRGQRPSNHH
jgi:hypothetical protein